MFRRRRAMWWLALLTLLVLVTGWHWGTQGGFPVDPARFTGSPSNAARARESDPTPSPDSSIQASVPGTTASRVALKPVRARTASEAAFQAALRPRAVPAKEPLAAPPDGNARLLVKFADARLARASADGRLLITDPGPNALSRLATLADDARLEFRRVVTSTESDLAGLEQRAAERSGEAQPDLAGLLEVRLPEPGAAALARVGHDLLALPDVEYVTWQPVDSLPPPPATDVAPPSALLQSSQTYRASNALGTDVAWTRYALRGHGVQVRDCEYQFNPDHEDLSGIVTMQAGIASVYTSFGPNHGTATLGELTAAENAYGMTGLAPGATTYFYPEFSQLTGGGTQYRSATVLAAVTDSRPGDVVMLEMQAGGTNSSIYVAAEYELAVWNAVKTGTSAGVIVVAAAGNGGDNLDAAGYAVYRARGDSGAIIVGAGNSSRQRLSFSTYGSRVNVQGWGSGVATLGYGDLQLYGGDANQAYTGTFSGTSSATPLVTGTAVLIQSLAKETLGRPLTPAEMRSLLVDTGRAQTGTTNQNIGPLPNLTAALQEMYVRFPLRITSYPGWGRYYFGNTNPPLGDDLDKDQIDNLRESFFGLSPFVRNAANRTELPRVGRTNTVSGGRLTLDFSHVSSMTDITWTAQRSLTLATGSWSNLTNGVNGVSISQTNDRVRVELPMTNSRAFLRLKLTR